MSKIQAKTNRLLKAFEKAVRENENSGSQHSEDKVSIDETYYAAKEKLETHLNSISEIAEIHVANLIK